MMQSFKKNNLAQSKCFAKKLFKEEIYGPILKDTLTHVKAGFTDSKKFLNPACRIDKEE